MRPEQWKSECKWIERRGGEVDEDEDEDVKWSEYMIVPTGNMTDLRDQTSS